MAIVTGPLLYVPNALASATEINTNFQNLFNDYNGNITNANLAANSNINPSHLAGMSSVNGFRLSSSSTLPLGPDVSSVSTIYLQPFNGSQIALNDGSGNFNLYDLGSTIPSLALSGLSTNNVYSIYLANTGTISSPVFTLTTAIWTNSTTPDSQTLIDGVITATANNKQRYVGAIYATGATTTSDTGSGGQRYIANANNLVLRPCQCSNDTWSYSGASLAGTSLTNGTGRITYLCALPNLNVSFVSNFGGSNSTSSGSTVAIGLNSATAATVGSGSQFISTSITIAAATVNGILLMGQGLNFLQRMVATSAGTFNSSTVGSITNSQANYLHAAVYV